MRSWPVGDMFASKIQCYDCLVKPEAFQVSKKEKWAQESCILVWNTRADETIMGEGFQAGAKWVREEAAKIIDCGGRKACTIERLADGSCMNSVVGRCRNDEAHEIRSIKIEGER